MSSKAIWLNPIPIATIAFSKNKHTYFLLNKDRRKCATKIFKLGGNVNPFDSTIISLNTEVFWLAKFRKRRIKIQTIYDLEA